MESQKSSYRLARLSGAQRVSAVAPDSVLSVPLLLLRPTRSDIASVSTGRRSRLGAIVQWERSPPYARPPPRRWGDPQRRRDLLKFYFYGRRAKRGSPESSVHGYRCRTPFRVCTLTEGVMRPRYPGRSRDQRKDCLALYAPFHLFVFTLFLVSLFFRPLLFLSLGLPLSRSLSPLIVVHFPPSVGFCRPGSSPRARPYFLYVYHPAPLLSQRPSTPTLPGILLFRFTHCYVLLIQ